MPALKDEIVLEPTNLSHVFRCDVDDSGLLREIVVMKKFKDGSIYYIDVASLHPIDQKRIKKIVTSIHANKYEAWELFNMSKLSNGMNALDFFHQNCVKSLHPRGAMSTIGGLAQIAGDVADEMIGSKYTDVSSGAKD